MPKGIQSLQPAKAKAGSPYLPKIRSPNQPEHNPWPLDFRLRYSEHWRLLRNKKPARRARGITPRPERKGSGCSSHCGPRHRNVTVRSIKLRTHTIFDADLVKKFIDSHASFNHSSPGHE